MTHDIEQRLAINLEMVMGEILAPRRSRFERCLLRLRMPEPTARLVAATPSLRWSWIAAVCAVLLFAASASGNATRPADQLAVLLALAPLVPIVAVAATYGPRADRSYEVTLVAPLSGLRLLIVRTLTVVAATAAITLLAAVTAPTGGWLRFAWLLPSAATTTVTLALASRIPIAKATAIVGVSWLLIVVAVGQLQSDAVAAFRWPAQILAAVIVIAATAHLAITRQRFERWVGE